MYLSIGKGRYSCPNSQLPPNPPLPSSPSHVLASWYAEQKTVKVVTLLSPGTFNPGNNRIVTVIRPGVAGSYTPAVRVRVHPRICEASHWLHAELGSPVGMKRARR